MVKPYPVRNEIGTPKSGQRAPRAEPTRRSAPHRNSATWTFLGIAVTGMHFALNAYRQRDWYGLNNSML
jgi:hypothetical protein